MKLEIWTDNGYNFRPGIWELCKKRGITKYFTGPLKVVLKDKPEKNDNFKVYFASRALMDDWKEHDKDIVEGKLNWFKYNINWCKQHNIRTYVDAVWETITDYMFHAEKFGESHLWKYLVENDIKVVCHTDVDHPNFISANRFFELEFTTTLYSNPANHCSLYLKPKWYDEKKYFYCSHLGCVATKYDIQRFLIVGMESGLIDDEFFWSVLNKRPHLLKKIVSYHISSQWVKDYFKDSNYIMKGYEPKGNLFFNDRHKKYIVNWVLDKAKRNEDIDRSSNLYKKYQHLFQENTWESRTTNYYNNTIKREGPGTNDIKLERRISPQMIDSECYVVFENAPSYHTEKTMKPIYAQLPFIIYARPHEGHKNGEPNVLNSNRRIKKLGYEIFEEVFDYSFEDKGLTAEGMMDEFIKELIRVKKEGRKIWEQPSIKEKVRYNHYLLLKRASTEEMMNYLYKLCLNDK